MSLAERRTKGELLRRKSARTVMSRNPKLLLLDEPTASGSGVIEEVTERLIQLARHILLGISLSL